MDKACVFVDHGYLQKLLEEYGKPHIVYSDFAIKLCEGEVTLLRTYLYDCMPYQSNPPTEDEREFYAGKQRFFTALNRNPRFEVRFGKMLKIPNASPRGFSLVQKRVDVLMSVDITRMSIGRQISRAILVTGDSDLVPAVKCAKDAGIEVYVWYARTGSTTVHDELLSECDECREFSRTFIDSVRTLTR